jgi:hypothetical protein
MKSRWVSSQSKSSATFSPMSFQLEPYWLRICEW